MPCPKIRHCKEDLTEEDPSQWFCCKENEWCGYQLFLGGGCRNGTMPTTTTRTTTNGDNLPCPEKRKCRPKTSNLDPTAWTCCKEGEKCNWTGLICIKDDAKTTTTTTTQIEWTMIYNFTGTMTTSSIKQERSDDEESESSDYDSAIDSGKYKEYSGEIYNDIWDKEILKQTEMWAN